VRFLAHLLRRIENCDAIARFEWLKSDLLYQGSNLVDANGGFLRFDQSNIRMAFDPYFTV